MILKIDLPENFIYNESALAADNLVWEYMQQRLSDIEEKTNQDYDKQENDVMSVVGFNWKSPSAILRSLLETGFKICSVLGLVAFYVSVIRPRINTVVLPNSIPT